MGRPDPHRPQETNGNNRTRLTRTNYRDSLSVLRDVDDPSSIWLVGDGDPDKFNEMMQDPGLAAAMQEAGVTGPPQVYIAT